MPVRGLLERECRAGAGICRDMTGARNASLERRREACHPPTEHLGRVARKPVGVRHRADPSGNSRFERRTLEARGLTPFLR
jgi:hypothetical protein